MESSKLYYWNRIVRVAPLGGRFSKDQPNRNGYARFSAAEEVCFLDDHSRMYGGKKFLSTGTTVEYNCLCQMALFPRSYCVKNGLAVS